MSSELEADTIIKDIRGEEYKIVSKLAEGAQGCIYELSGNKIAKIYHKEECDREKCLNQLHWIMKKNIPQDTRIAKPLAILAKPYTGYIMKQVSENYEPLSKYNNINTKYRFSEWFNDITGGLKKRLQIGILLGKSLRSLHFEGLTYCDVSPSNILVSPKKNSIAIIDADNLMATEVFTANILGTPGYIAPELLSEARQPNSLSDTYSFAVLMFEMLCLGHPLVGDSVLEDTPEAEEMAVKGNSVYVNHPTDASNRNSRVSKLMILLTDKMKSLFEQTFVKVNILSGWEYAKNTIATGIDFIGSGFKLMGLSVIKAMETALDQLVLCKNPNCSASFLYEQDAEVKCPFCLYKEDSVDHLIFRRSINVKDFSIIDYEKTGKMKSFGKLIEIPSLLVLNKDVTYIRKRHFDSNINTNADDKVLKIEKTRNKKYTVTAIDDKLAFGIFRKEGGKSNRMEYGKKYDFIYDDTAIFFEPNSNLIDGSELAMDNYIRDNVTVKKNDISVTEYVAIYY